MILDWRTSERVAKYLKTEVIMVEDQEQWIISCRDRVSFYHWLIMFQEKPIGYISINKYNPIAQTASWDFTLERRNMLDLAVWYLPSSIISVFRN